MSDVVVENGTGVVAAGQGRDSFYDRYLLSGSVTGARLVPEARTDEWGGAEYRPVGYSGEGMEEMSPAERLAYGDYLQVSRLEDVLRRANESGVDVGKESEYEGMSREYEVRSARYNDYLDRSEARGVDPWSGVRSLNVRRERERKEEVLAGLDVFLGLDMDRPGTWDRGYWQVDRMAEVCKGLSDEMQGEYVARQVMGAYAVERFGVAKEHVVKRNELVRQCLARYYGVEDGYRSVMQAIREERAEGKARVERFNETAGLAYDLALDGRSFREVRSRLRESTGGEYGDFVTALGAYEEAYRRGADVRRFAEENVAVLTGAMDALLSVEDHMFESWVMGNKVANNPEVVKGVDLLGGCTDAQRYALFKLAKERAAQAGGDGEEGYLEKVSRKFSRGMAALGKGMVRAVDGVWTSAYDLMGDEDAVKERDAYMKFFDVLESMAQDEYKPVRDVRRADWLGDFGTGVLDFTESLPQNLLMFSGMPGVGLFLASAVGDSYSEGVGEYGGVLSPGQLMWSSTAAGAANTAVEFVMTRAGLKAGGMLGKGVAKGVDLGLERVSRGRLNGTVSGGFERLLGRSAGWFADKPVRRAVLNGAGVAVTETGSEFLEERVQKPLSPTSHALVASLAGVAPQYDWERFYADLTGSREENARLVWAVLPFGLLGGAGGSIKGYRDARRMLENERVLKGCFGFTEEQWGLVRDARDDEAAGQFMRDGIKAFLDKRYRRPDAMCRADDLSEMMVMAASGGMSLERLVGKVTRFAQANGVKTSDVAVTYDARSGALEVVSYVESPVAGEEMQAATEEQERGVLEEGEVEFVAGDVRGGESRADVVGEGEDFIPGLEPGGVDGGAVVGEEGKVDGRVMGYLQGKVRLLEEAGYAVVTPEAGGRFSYRSGVDGRKVVLGSYQEAYESWVDDCLDVQEEMLGRVKGVLDEESLNAASGDAVKEAVGSVSGAGSVLPHRKVEYVKDILKERLKGPQAEVWKRQFKARVRLLAEMEAEDGGVFDEEEVRVLGENYLDYARDGLVRANMAVAEGASPLDVLEEESELRLKFWLRNGVLTADRVEGWLRELEKATGDRYLAKGMLKGAEEVEREMAIVEGFSRAARAYAMGDIAEGKAPRALVDWFRKVLALMSEYWSVWSDLMRARNLKGAISEGELDQVFVDFLSDSIGGRDARRAEDVLRHDMEGAVSGAQEVRSFARGRLPHWEVARAQGSPWWRVIRELQERDAGLVMGMDGVKQKDVAGVVRKAMKGVVADARSAGFDVRSLHDVLDMLNDSVAYGIRRYAGVSYGEGSGLGDGVENRSFAVGNGGGRLEVDPAEVEAWKGRLDDYFEGRLKGGNMPVKVCSMPDVLKAIGYSDRDVVIKPRVLEKIYVNGQGYADSGKHGLTDDHLDGLPEAIWNPIMVLNSATVAGAVVELTDLKVGPANVLVAVHFDKNMKNGVFHVLASVYDKQGTQMYEEQIKNGNLLYVDKKRALDWARSNGLQLPKVASQEGKSNVLTPEDIVNGKGSGEGAGKRNAQAWVRSNGRQLPKVASQEGEVNVLDTEGGVKDGRGETMAADVRRKGRSIFDVLDDLMFAEENADLPELRIGKKMKGDEGMSAVERTHWRRVNVYAEVKERLEKSLARYGVDRYGMSKRPGGAGLDYDGAATAQGERKRVMAVLDVVNSFAGALNAGLRGKLRLKRIGFDEKVGRLVVTQDIVRELTEARDGKERDAAMGGLIRELNLVMERDMGDRHLAWVKRYLEWAKAKVGKASGVRKGKLTADTAALIERIEQATLMTSEEVNDRLEVLRGKVDKGSEDFGVTDEVLRRDQEEVVILERFGAIGALTGRGGYVKSAEDMALALDELKAVYSQGRLLRREQETARRDANRAASLELVEMLGFGEGIPGDAAAVMKQKEKGKGDMLRQFGDQYVSFEQLLGYYYAPDSPVVVYVNNGIRESRKRFNRLKVEARGRADARLKEVFGVKRDRDVRGRIDEMSRTKKWEGIFSRKSAQRVEFGVDGGDGKVRFRLSELELVLEGNLEGFKGKEDRRYGEWMELEVNKAILRNKVEEARLGLEKEKRKKYASMADMDPYVGFTVLLPGEVVKEGGEPKVLELSEMEAVYLVQLFRQERYWINLLATGYDEQMMMAIEARLSPEAKAIIGFMREEYDLGYEQYNELYREVYGVDMPRVKDYVPGYFINVGGMELEMDPEGSPIGAGGMKNGALKARKFHTANVQVVSAMEVFLNHQERMNYWFSFADHMRNVRSILLNPVMQGAIQATQGMTGYKRIRGWVEALENGGVVQADTGTAFNRFINNSISATSKGALSWPFRTMIRQFPAALASAAGMSFQDWFRGIRNVLRHPEDFKVVWESEAVQHRLELGFSPEMRAALGGKRLDGNSFVRFVHDVVEGGLELVGRADAFFTTMSAMVAYRSQYELARSEGATHEQAQGAALEVMDRVVRNTAQPSEMEQKSWIEVSAPAWIRPFTVFRSDPRKQAAIAVNALRMAAKGKMRKGEAFWRVFNAWCVYGILDQLTLDFIAYMFKGDDDDELFSWEDYAVSSMLGPMAGVYIFGDVMVSLTAYLMGEKAWPSKSTVTSVVDGVKDLVKYPERVMEALESEDMGKVVDATYKASRGVTSAVGFAAPSLIAGVQTAGTAARDLKNVATRFDERPVVVKKGQKEIIDEFRRGEKAAMKERDRALDRVVRESDGLSEEELKGRLKGLSRSDRRLVLERVRKAGEHPLTSQVRAVKAENRSVLVGRLLETIEDPAERAQFLKEVGRLNGVKRRPERGSY